MERMKIIISGRVQAVFFRHYLKKLSEGLGLKGWVKNTRDGRVECLAEGSRESLKKLLAWSKKGPLGAEVERVEEEWSKAEGNFTSFEIK